MAELVANLKVVKDKIIVASAKRSLVCIIKYFINLYIIINLKIYKLIIIFNILLTGI